MLSSYRLRLLLWGHHALVLIIDVRRRRRLRTGRGLRRRHHRSHGRHHVPVRIRSTSPVSLPHKLLLLTRRPVHELAVAVTHHHLVAHLSRAAVVRRRWTLIHHGRWWCHSVWCSVLHRSWAMHLYSTRFLFSLFFLVASFLGYLPS
jgi:hypothetical protein